MKKSLFFSIRLLAFLAILLGSAFSTLRQGDGPQIRITQIDTSEFPRVTFYVSFSDSNGDPLTIDPGRLTIFENNETIPADQIEGFGDVGPLTTLLLMDISGSMNNVGKLEAAESAANEFVAQMREIDQAGLLAFNTNFETIQELTTSKVSLNEAMDNLTASGETAMYDALLLAIDQFEGISGRKAIIVLTDGMDNASNSNAANVIEKIGPTGFSISTVGLGVPKDYVDELAGIDEEALIGLADQAGGLYGYAEDEASLTKLYQGYAITLQSEYAITYTSPAELRDGVNRSLTVSLQGGAGVDAGENQGVYNPGGLVPEVVEPVSWQVFFSMLGALVLLLLLPTIFSRTLRSFSGKQSKDSGIKLGDRSRSKPKIKLKD